MGAAAGCGRSGRSRGGSRQSPGERRLRGCRWTEPMDGQSRQHRPCCSASLLGWLLNLDLFLVQVRLGLTCRFESQVWPRDGGCSAASSRSPHQIGDLGFAAAATPLHLQPAAVLPLRCLLLPGAARASVPVLCVQAHPCREGWCLLYGSPAVCFVLMFRPCG